MKPAVFRIKNFAEAIGAGRDVGQYQRGFVSAGFTRADFKIFMADGVEPRRFKALDETARRLFGIEPQKKFFQFRARPLDFDENALRRIVDPAGKF